jgi:hypothetical protein
MVGRHELVYHDAGVSESIGFLLIFAIVITGIGMVTLYGYPMLMKQQSSADEQIMEKNMIVLQNDVKSLAYKTVPYQETSLKVDGGALTVYNTTYAPTKASYFSIYGTSLGPNCVQNDDGSCATTPTPVHPGDLRYESTSAQTGISLENGAVVTRPLAQTGSTMLAEPRWFYDRQTSTAVIYLIAFNTTDATGITGQTGVGTVKMELNTTSTKTFPIDPLSTIYVKYSPNTDADYSTAWGNYFTGTLGMKSDGGGVYHFDPTPRTVVIKKSEIIVRSV